MMIAAEGCAMVDELTTDEIRNLLKLEPHATCGSVRITYLSPQSIAAGGLPPPFSAPRPMGSALYFMVTPTAPVQLHGIRDDQLYHYYLGDPLEVLLLRSDGTTDRVVVGPNLRGGEHLQLFIPGDTFHTARVIGRRRWFLGAAPSGQAWCPPTSRPAMSRHWRRSTRRLPLTCAPSRPRSGTIEVRLRERAASPFSPLALPATRGSARAA